MNKTYRATIHAETWTPVYVNAKTPEEARDMLLALLEEGDRLETFEQPEDYEHQLEDLREAVDAELAEDYRGRPCVQAANNARAYYDLQAYYALEDANIAEQEANNTSHHD